MAARRHKPGALTSLVQNKQLGAVQEHRGNRTVCAPIGGIVCPGLSRYGPVRLSPWIELDRCRDRPPAGQPRHQIAGVSVLLQPGGDRGQKPGQLPRHIVSRPVRGLVAESEVKRGVSRLPAAAARGSPSPASDPRPAAADAASPLPCWPPRRAPAGPAS